LLDYASETNFEIDESAPVWQLSPVLCSVYSDYKAVQVSVADVVPVAKTQVSQSPLTSCAAQQHVMRTAAISMCNFCAAHDSADYELQSKARPLFATVSIIQRLYWFCRGLSSKAGWRRSELSNAP